MTETKTKDLSVTEVISLLGGFGLFQWLIIVSFCIMSPPQVFQILFMVFGGDDPLWRCTANSTVCRFPKPMPFFVKARCMMPRSEWEYTTPKDYSISTEFDLQCDRAWMRHLMFSILFVGWGVGAILLGWVADNYGRRFVIYLSQVMVIFFGFIMAFLKSVALLIICRFIIGLFIPAGVVQTIILISEYVDSKHRPVASLLLFVAFSLSASLFALKAYFIRQWRVLLMACTAPYLVTAVSFFFVPESIRWVRLKRGKDDVMNIIQRIANWNKKPLPDDVNVQPPPEDVTSNPSVMDIFQERRMGVISIVLGYTWMVNSMVFYSLVFAAKDLGSNPYLNLFLLMTVNLPSNGLAMVFCNRIGRKPTVLIFMTLSSLICGGIGFIPGGSVARLVLAMLGDFFISISFGGSYVWSLEVYTTDIRASAMGFLQVTSRLGAATAPWISFALKEVHPAAPYAVMCGATLLAPIPLMLVPETRDTVIADTRQESVVYQSSMYQEEYKEGEEDDEEGEMENGKRRPRKTLIEILREQEERGEEDEDDSDKEKEGEDIEMIGNEKRKADSKSSGPDQGKPGKGKGNEVESAVAPLMGVVFDSKRRMSEEISRRLRRKKSSQKGNTDV